MGKCFMNMCGIALHMLSTATLAFLGGGVLGHSLVFRGVVRNARVRVRHRAHEYGAPPVGCSPQCFPPRCQRPLKVNVNTYVSTTGSIGQNCVTLQQATCQAGTCVVCWVVVITCAQWRVAGCHGDLGRDGVCCATVCRGHVAAWRSSHTTQNDTAL
jgi:hypothetical protein